MRFEMMPENKRFLALAVKVASGEASGEQQAELELLLKSRPELRQEFEEIQRELRKAGQKEFWDSALRVIFGTASPKERKHIESLKSSDPEQWEHYQDAVDFLEALSSCPASMAGMKLEPMPPHVRKELLLNLKAPSARHGKP